MKHTLLLATALCGVLSANECCPPCDYNFYLKVDTGISCSESAEVHATSETWTPAVQGYNSSLGNRAIGGLTVGCEFKRLLDLEVSIANRSTFKYRKHQTPVDGDITYTRQFDLGVTDILFSVNLLGRNYPCLNWNIACGTVYPVIGAGVGISNLCITNFRTTGLPPSGDSAPYASFASENQHTSRRNFTYTALIGFEYNYNDIWAISTGYRWFDAGKFNGPRYIRTDTGAAVDVGGNTWKMRFRANEWFVGFKLFI